jgi:hypothetical protein
MQYLLAQPWLKELPSVYRQPDYVRGLEELEPIYPVMINQ